MVRYCLPTIAASALLVTSAPAQETPADTRPVIVIQQPDGPPPFMNVRGFSGDYQVGPGDLLDIQVVGNDALRQSLRVSNSGEISFPMLDLVPVAELTSFQIEAEIARRLTDKGLVNQPEVLVFIRDYQAKPVYVSGAVVNPGEFIMSQDLTVIDAILLAGGLRFNAADEGLLHRRSKQGVETIKVDLRPLKQGQFLESALPLKRGDSLVVPELYMNAFFVVGEVLDPRNFFYIPGKTLMASQAISSAGGPLPTAKLSDGMLVRYDAQGNRTELRVDWGAILSGKQPDFPIRPNDVIFVPGSKVKTITHGMLALSDAMVMGASFRVGRRMQLNDPAERPERPLQEP
jgi:polysaccharide biosynthesis/export protein